jgi:hypothetical protein
MIAKLNTFARKLGENVLLTIMTTLAMGILAALCWAGRLPNPLSLLPRQTEVRLTNQEGAPMAQVALMEARREGKDWKVGTLLGVTDENGCAVISVGPGIQGLGCFWGAHERLWIRNTDASVWSNVCRISPAQREVRLVVKHTSTQDAR